MSSKHPANFTEITNNQKQTWGKGDFLMKRRLETSQFSLPQIRNNLLKVYKVIRFKDINHNQK